MKHKCPFYGSRAAARVALPGYNVPHSLSAPSLSLPPSLPLSLSRSLALRSVSRLPFLSPSLSLLLRSLYRPPLTHSSCARMRAAAAAAAAEEEEE